MSPVSAAAVTLLVALQAACVATLAAASSYEAASLRRGQAVAAPDLDSPSTISASRGVLSAVVASLIVSLTSLGGVVVLRLHTKRSADQGDEQQPEDGHSHSGGDDGHHHHHHAAAASSSLVDLMTTFACGCLLGVVAFHLLPEATEKLNEQPDTPEWLLGGLLLAGVLGSLTIEVAVHAWLSHGHDHDHDDPPSHSQQPVKSTSNLLNLPLDTPAAPTSTASSSTTLPSSPSSSPGESEDHVHSTPSKSPPPTHLQSAPPPKNHSTIAPLAWITAVGDCTHAFTDGIVIAIAFQSCSASLGWVVVLGILLHEVPHRIGDFFVFLRSGLSPLQAVLLNTLASGGSLMGVLTVAALGTVSESTLGAMLALGAGSLLFIALAELLPPVLRVHERRTALHHIAWLTLGCVLIWLSALHEVECEAA